MPDGSAALKLAEKLNDDITSLEDDFEHLRETQRKLAQCLDTLDSKVSDFVIEYRSGMRDVTESLAMQNVLVERILDKRRNGR
jgi:hypothetical protein